MFIRRLKSRCFFSSCFQDIFSEANGIWNHVSFRHLGCVFLLQQFLCVFFPPIPKNAPCQSGFTFFPPIMKGNSFQKQILQASPYHLPSDCFVGNLHKNWQAVNKKGLKRKNDDVRTNPMTLQTKRRFFGEISPGHGCHVPACASSIQGVLPG